MLAPTPYLTAAELGITENEHTKLVEFCRTKNIAGGFDMGDPCRCIIGFMRGHYNLDEAFRRSRFLTSFWYANNEGTMGGGGGPGMRNITLPIAQFAVEQALRTGKVDWPLAVSVCGVETENQ